MGVSAEEIIIGTEGHRLAGTIVHPEVPGKPAILCLAGLGAQANRRIPRYLLDPLAERGHGSLVFDFAGNGDSTGVFLRSCLRQRYAETLAAAAYLSEDARPVVIGTSMGGHLAGWTAPVLKPRAMVLFCPATYPERAAGVPFADYLANSPNARREDDRFIRPGPFADSPGYAGIRGFDGDLLIIVGRQDEVVSDETVEGWLAQAENARSKQVVSLDCGHFIHRWLPDREVELAQVVAAIAQVVDGDRNGAMG